MIESDPSGNFVLGADLGTDTIHIWRLNQQTGKLDPTRDISVTPGDGPRHFVFHPNGRWVYSLQEEASTLILFDRLRSMEHNDGWSSDRCIAIGAGQTTRGLIDDQAL